MPMPSDFEERREQHGTVLEKLASFGWRLWRASGISDETIGFSSQQVQTASLHFGKGLNAKKSWLISQDEDEREFWLGVYGDMEPKECKHLVVLPLLHSSFFALSSDKKEQKSVLACQVLKLSI